MTYETLLTDLADGVMTVTLNRPDKLIAVLKALSLSGRFSVTVMTPSARSVSKVS